jgi:hypothetical protein
MGYSEMLADSVSRQDQMEEHDRSHSDHAVELLDLVSATLDVGRLEARRRRRAPQSA